MRAWLTLPNLLTITRIAVIPIIFLLWSTGHAILAAISAALAALTDFLDGRLARSLNQESYIGAILDPVADKIMVISLFGLLLHAGVLPYFIFWVSVIRNFSQLLSIPILIFWKKIPFKVKPRFIPKFASGLSFAIIIVGLLMTNPNLMSESQYSISRLFFISLIILGILDVQILINYWPRFFQILNHKHDTFE